MPTQHAFFLLSPSLLLLSLFTTFSLFLPSFLSPHPFSPNSPQSMLAMAVCSVSFAGGGGQVMQCKQKWLRGALGNAPYRKQTLLICSLWPFALCPSYSWECGPTGRCCLHLAAMGVKPQKVQDAEQTSEGA